MKNIHLYCAEQVLDASVSKKIAGSQSVCVDYASGRLFFLTGGDSLLIVEADGASQETVSLNLLSEVSERSPVVSFDFLPDSSEICFICRSGHVFTYDSIGKEMSERGCIINEVWGAAWSPDFQPLVVATHNQLISISRDFDTINEVDLFPTHPGKEELQTIGWGSRQTQFQGQAGKASREKIDVDRLPTDIHEWDKSEYNTLISWRGDSQLLATSTVERISHEALRDNHPVLSRRIRIWDRNLQFLSCCDILAGIEPTLTLRPGKSVILTSRLFGYENERPSRSIWFFEQNGQYYRNALLPMGEDAIVKRLQWNADGSVLMIVVQYSTLEKDQLQFWTVSNAEWALKSAFDFTDRIVDCFFSQEIFMVAYCLVESGQFWKFEMNRVYHCEDGIAVSVCGDAIRFSDFNKAPIPPPMCHFTVKLPENVKTPHEFVSSLALNAKGQLAVISSALNLHFFEFENLEARCSGTVSCQQLSSGIVYGINWATNEKGCITVCCCDGVKWTVFKIQGGEFSEVYMSKIPIVYQILADERLFVADLFGKCSIVNVTSRQVERTFDTRTMSFFMWKFIRSKKEKLIGLSPRHALMFNDKVILENCTSFSVTSTEDYVLASTFSNKLHLISLDSLDEERASSADFIIGEGRLLERGANIVGHESGGGTRCVLQMPRGNLEQIHPRDLLVERTKKLIDRKEYRNALKEMRRHRLNMNLLFDHDPDSFVTNISEFVSQFDATQQLDVDLLLLFLADLEDEDCTRTLFAKSYKNNPLTSKHQSAVSVTGKVQKICGMLLNQLKSNEGVMDSRAFEQIYTVILSCYVKPKPGKVVEALMDLKRRAERCTDEAARNQFLSSSLRHLCYSVQEAVLFDSALKTYDLDIVSMIADKQQKDPREYLAIIAELRSKMPEEYRNYFICVRLQDWKQALKHLANVPERFDECLSLIKQQNLYVDALSIFNGTEKYRELCQTYADYMFSNTQYHLAALFFEKCQSWDKSLKSFELGRLHNEFIRFYARLDADQKEQLHKSYTDGLKKMAVQLEQRDRFQAVAEVLRALDVESNLTKILEMYAKAENWSEAVNLAREQRQPDLVIELLKQRAQSILTLLNEWTETVQRQYSRLIILREQKAKQLEDWSEARGDVDLGQSETMSEASGTTNMSRVSSASTASGRRRKNIQKKKAVIKEGSRYEDAAILISLKNLFTTLDNMQDDMCQLLPALLSVDLIDEATRTHKRFDDVLTKCQSLSKTLWPEFLKPRDLPGPIYETYRGEDGIVRMPEPGAMPLRIRMEEELFPPVFRKNIPWKLNHFV